MGLCFDKHSYLYALKPQKFVSNKVKPKQLTPRSKEILRNLGYSLKSSVKKK